MTINGVDIIHHWSMRHSIGVGKTYTYTHPEFKWTITIHRITEDEFEFSVIHQLPSEQSWDFTTKVSEQQVIYATD